MTIYHQDEARITVFKEHSNQIFPETSSTFLARGNQGIRKRNRKPLLYLSMRETRERKRKREKEGDERVGGVIDVRRGGGGWFTKDS